MSKGAGKIALGQGLMSFGQGIGQAMDAQERRRQSLEDIRNRFNTQMALINQRQSIADQADARDWERGAPEREARLGLLNAQTEAAQALAAARNAIEAPDSPALGFNNFDPEDFTTESITAYHRHLQENPQDAAGAMELLRNKDTGESPHFDPERVGRSVMDDVDALLPVTDGKGYMVDDPVGNFIDSNPALAQAAGITPGMDLFAAKRALAEHALRQRVGGQQPELTGGRVSEQDVIGVVNALLGQGDGGFIPPNAFDQWSENQ